MARASRCCCGHRSKAAGARQAEPCPSISQANKEHLSDLQMAEASCCKPSRQTALAAFLTMHSASCCSGHRIVTFSLGLPQTVLETSRETSEQELPLTSTL